jgi:hypothetical protein
MESATFTITKISGMTTPRVDARGSLKPPANGSYVKASPGVGTRYGSAKRSHLRLVK